MFSNPLICIIVRHSAKSGIVPEAFHWLIRILSKSTDTVYFLWKTMLKKISYCVFKGG